MWRSLVWTLGLLALAPVLVAQEKSKDPPKKSGPSPAAKQYQELLGEFSKARTELVSSFRKAKTKKEKDKIRKDYRVLPNKFAARFVELAKNNPKDPVSFDSLVWVISKAGEAREAPKAAEALVQDHLKNERLPSICQRLAFHPSKAGEILLSAVLAKSSDHELQGWACYGLAKSLKNRAGDDEKLQAKAEKFYERVTKEFSDVKSRRGSLAEMSKNELFEMRYLTIGKVAPEIKAEDIDGEVFKLSDYRGKVVMLDFWGNW